MTNRDRLIIALAVAYVLTYAAGVRSILREALQ